MKNNFSLTVLLLSLFISVAGFSQGVKTSNKTAKLFLDMLDGTEATATKAVANYGTKTVIDNKMIPFGKSAVIYKEVANCVSFYIIDGDTKNAYIICTKNEKIESFEIDWDFEAK